MKLNPILSIASNQIDLERKSAPSGKLDDKTAMRDLQLHKKSKELESVFLTQLIKSMEKTIPEGVGGGKNSLSTMMFSSVMGDAMAEGGGIGLSKMIYASLKNRVDQDDLPEIGGKDYLETMNFLQHMNSTEDL